MLGGSPELGKGNPGWVPSDLEFRVWDLGFRFLGLGFGVLGFMVLWFGV